MASPLRLPRPAYTSDPGLEQILGRLAPERPLNIVFIGAHPDDPESGCGGTIAKLVRDRHRVTLVYLTRGEAGVERGDHATTAKVRTAEALTAAGILGAKAVFANQIDGQTSISREHSERFTDLLRSLHPHVVFTHWPHDTHRDHRNVAALTRAAWESLNRSFTLVYYEVMTGIQTYDFQPNVYVDISPTGKQKRSAIYAHACQNPDHFYPHHRNMERQRGSEAKLLRAEAFIVVRHNAPAPLISFPSTNASCRR